MPLDIRVMTSVHSVQLKTGIYNKSDLSYNLNNQIGTHSAIIIWDKQLSASLLKKSFDNNCLICHIFDILWKVK